MQIIATLPNNFTMQDANYDPHLFWIIAIVTRRSCFLQMTISKIQMIFVSLWTLLLALSTDAAVYIVW